MFLGVNHVPSQGVGAPSVPHFKLGYFLLITRLKNESMCGQ